MHASSIHHKILTIPGLHNSGPAHWQSLWQQKFPDTRRVDLGDWDNPDQALWVARIADAIDAESAPVLIAAHSLGCHAFAHWLDRKSVVSGKSVSVRVDLGGRGIIKKKKRTNIMSRCVHGKRNTTKPSIIYKN